MPVAILSGAVVYLLNLPWFGEAAITCALLATGIAISRVVSMADLQALVRRQPAEMASGAAIPGGGS